MFKTLKSLLEGRISTFEGMVLDESTVEDTFEEALMEDATTTDDIDTIMNIIPDDYLDADDRESEDSIDDDILSKIIFPDNKKEIESLVARIPGDAPKMDSSIDNSIKQDMNNTDSNVVPDIDDLNDNDDDDSIIEQDGNAVSENVLDPTWLDIL